MQTHQQARIAVLFHFLGSEFQDGKPIFTKMALDSSASSPPISMLGRWIDVIPRYVVLLNTIDVSTVGIRLEMLRSPATASTEGSIYRVGCGLKPPTSPLLHRR